VRETVLNDEMECSEQRGVLSVGRDVCYTTVFWTQLYRKREGGPTLAFGKGMQYILSVPYIELREKSNLNNYNNEVQAIHQLRVKLAAD
jgi:hypothetical protein